MTNEDRTMVVDADQYARLKPYLVAKGVSLAAVVNMALKDHLEPSDSARMEIKAQSNKTQSKHP
jgi:hypothetical protein